MRSWDPMRNFPELDGLPAAEAKALVGTTQKKVVREPKILIGLVAAVLVTAIIVFNIPIFHGGILGGALAGALIGLVAFVYLVIVVKPRMSEAFRQMGYPTKTVA